MSGQIQSYIYCDDCSTAYDYQEGNRIRAIRKEATNDGWIRKGRKDFCPGCNPDAKVNGGHDG